MGQSAPTLLIVAENYPIGGPRELSASRESDLCSNSFLVGHVDQNNVGFGFQLGDDARDKLVGGLA